METRGSPEEARFRELESRREKIHREIIQLKDLVAESPLDLPRRDTLLGLLTAASVIADVNYSSREKVFLQQLSRAVSPLGLEVRQQPTED